MYGIEMSVFEPRESRKQEQQGAGSGLSSSISNCCNETQYQKYKRFTQRLRPIPQPSKVYDEIKDQTLQQAMSITTDIVQ